MGVPGFFAWLMKQDRNKSILINKLNFKPNTLYFDANCLFHPQCFKILKLNPYESNIEKLEQLMMDKIINYIDFIINYISPTDLVYIAVDGVAPLAKINQQRKRRYKSIEENKMKNDIYKKYNVPNNTNWSNIVITPGTEFMKKLDKFIQKYIEKNNKKYKIIYSSYLEKGEGEHKIFQHIKDNYKNNEKTHIIYGLDADLIFLSLASNYNSIYLLREKTHLGEKTVKEDEMIFVSINNSRKIFNDYFRMRLDLDIDIDIDKDKDKDNNQQIDFIPDFIFLCYFIGNDFIPHIPSISIRNDGIEILLDAYLYAYERSEEKLINIDYEKEEIVYSKTCFKLFLQFLTDMENKYFKEDKHYKVSKSAPSHLNKCDKELWELENLVKINKNHDPFKLYSEFVDLNTAKTNYYLHYFNMRFNLNNQIKKITMSFFKILKWVGIYYFNKAPCWNIQYDYDASPFISDLYENYEQFFNINIEKSDESFNIEQQLLSVIPPLRKNILNKQIQDKMKDLNIIHMLPEKVQYDYEYKDKFWLCEAIMPYLNYEEIVNKKFK
jgi:5'-3' exoribonuclease 2